MSLFYSAGLGTAIPDSVVARTADDDTFNTSTPFGHLVSVSQDWPSIDAKISSNTSGLTTAYIYAESDGDLIKSVDISSLSAGEVFRFEDVNLTAGNDYRIIGDAGGSNYDMGHKNSASYPFTSSDGNLELVEGRQGDTGDTAGDVAGNFVEIGNLQ